MFDRVEVAENEDLFLAFAILKAQLIPRFFLRDALYTAA
jgi:hypothetical protein